MRGKKILHKTAPKIETSKLTFPCNCTPQNDYTTNPSLSRSYKDNDDYHIKQAFNTAMTWKHRAISIKHWQKQCRTCTLCCTLDPAACPGFLLQILESSEFDLACVEVY